MELLSMTTDGLEAYIYKHVQINLYSRDRTRYYLKIKRALYVADSVVSQELLYCI
jgi:hypothetical protein